MSDYAPYLVIVPLSQRDAANAAARQLSRHPDQEGDNFTIPLGGAELGPVTHYGCSVSLQPDKRQAVENLIATSFPGASLTACKLPGDAGALPTPREAWIAAGLVRVTESD